MMGISGISGEGSMPRNCGMQGMHGNYQTKQAPKSDDSAAKQQNNQPIESLKVAAGNKIDLRI